MEIASEDQVSIIVVSWNSSEVTLKCLKKLEECRAHLKVQVLLSDNGSCDDTILESKRRFPWVSVLENGKNLGFSAAVNRALKLAKGKYTLLLNSDAEIEVSALQTLIETMERNPDIGVLSPQLIYPGGRLQNTVATIPSLATELLNKKLLQTFWPEKYLSKKTIFEVVTEVPSVIGACFLTRTELMKDLSGLDERYFFYLEETDYCLRVQQRKLKVCINPEVQVKHLQGYSAKKVSFRPKVEFHRSLFTFFEIHYGRSTTRWLKFSLFIQYLFKIITTTMALLLTLFTSTRLRKKLVTYLILTYWQVLGMPQFLGLKRG